MSSELCVFNVSSLLLVVIDTCACGPVVNYQSNVELVRDVPSD